MNKKSLKVRAWEELESRGWVTPLSQAPETFCEWWKNHDLCPRPSKSRDGCKGWSGGITAHKAWQCSDYRNEFSVRGKEFAAGTGINYAYFNWFRPYPGPRTSNPALLEEHQAWCRERGKPVPLEDEQEIPAFIRDAQSFDDIKVMIQGLGESMNMNKAIDWTEEDSEALGVEQ